MTVLGLVGAVAGGWAQDPQLSQSFAAPLYLNPALTGNTYQDRIILNYRMQWAGVPRGFETYAVSYDHRSEKLHSGIGGMVMRDRAGSNGLAFTHAALSYSYEARINRTSAVRGGIRAGYTSRHFDPSNLLFADQVIRDNAAVTIEPAMIERVHYMDVSAGVMYYNEHVWAGASFNHLNRPQQSLLITGDTRLPIRGSVHAGYRWAIDGQRMDRAETIGTLAVHYKAQDKWDQLDLGGYLTHQGLMAGLWYRGIPGFKAYRPGYPNNEAFIVLLGYETPMQLQVAYSYDITISTLTMASRGAHELSVIYEWPRKAKTRKYRVVPCPKF